MQTFVLSTHLTLKAESFCAENSTGSSKIQVTLYPIPSPLRKVLAFTFFTHPHYLCFLNLQNDTFRLETHIGYGYTDLGCMRPWAQPLGRHK